MATNLFSPAKLTKYLKITGVRSDGMHQIEAEMVSVSFGDQIVISDGFGIEIIDKDNWMQSLGVDISAIPLDKDNLMSKALRLVDKQAHIHLVKRIPPGAGLGGGSSNAGAVLRHFGISGSDEKAARLGADVPFCVNGGRALAGGIGDQLDDLSYQFESYVMLISPFGVSTPEVYRCYDQIGTGGKDPVNHLEAAAITCEPRLKDSKAILAEISGRDPYLAGSGSTYFVQGTLDDFESELEIKQLDNFRFADISNGSTKYRLVETYSVARAV